MGVADKGRASWSPADDDVVEDRRCQDVEDGIFLYDTSPLPLLVSGRDVDRELYLLRERMSGP